MSSKNKQKVLYKLLVNILLVVALFSVCSCKSNAVVNELNDSEKMTIIVVLPYKNDGEGSILKKRNIEIINSLKELIGVEVELKSTNDVDSAIKLLDQQIVDYVVGVPLNNNYYGEYAVSNVYEEKYIYCVTNSIFDNDNIYGLNLENTAISSKLLEIDMNNIRAIYEKNGKSINIMSETEKVKSYLKVKNSNRNYLCYKEEALDIMKDEDDMRIHRLRDITPVELVVLNNKKNKRLLDVVNKAIASK